MDLDIPTAPWPLTAAFVAIVLTLVALFTLAVRRGFAQRGAAAQRRATLATAAAWLVVLVLGGVLSGSGALLSLVGSPRLLLMPAATLLVATAIGLSPVGQRVAAAVPLWALIGFQAFRLPLELVLHALHEAGALPVQMTYLGSNVDIVAGALALGAGAGLRLGWLGRGSAWLVNAVGLALLANVTRVALTSMPTPLLAFDAPLLLPLTAPFFWILPVCVGGALMGHVVAFRALASQPDSRWMPAAR